MPAFNEANTVEAFISDLLSGYPPGSSKPSQKAASRKVGEEQPPAYVTAGRNERGLGWHHVPAAQLPRRIQDVFVEEYIREALIRLNPTIAAQPDRADEVLHKLRAIVLSVRSDGLIR